MIRIAQKFRGMTLYYVQFHTAIFISQEGMGHLETLLSRTKTSINEPSALIDHIPEHQCSFIGIFVLMTKTKY